MVVALYQFLNFEIPELESPEFCMDKRYGHPEKLKVGHRVKLKVASGKRLRLHQRSGPRQAWHQWTAPGRFGAVRR